MPDLKHIQCIDGLNPNQIPAQAEAFLTQLGRPSWIRLPGQDRSRQRIVVTLLHGNEPSGFRAMHAWLRAGHKPRVDTIFYIGSVAAALADGPFQHRTLNGDRDANRCYGASQSDTQGQIAAEFTALLQSEQFEALIDIHNNTGHNPAYGIGYGVDSARLNLTALFADWYMHSDLTMHTLVEMSEQHCPSISVECGRAGDPAADAAALAGLDRFLHIDDLRLDAPAPAQLKILQHPHRVSLNRELALAFADTAIAGADLTLRNDIDEHNFARLSVGTPLGWVRSGLDLPLQCIGASEHDKAAEWFGVENGVLTSRVEMIPIMMTTDAHIAKTDCLFYAMQQAENHQS